MSETANIRMERIERLFGELHYEITRGLAMDETRKSPDEWFKLPEFRGLRILDPDGWNRRAEDWDAEWSRPLTYLEFNKKLMLSTCSWPVGEAPK